VMKRNGVHHNLGAFLLGKGTADDSRPMGLTVFASLRLCVSIAVAVVRWC
jgi:hypothetical protein